MKMNRIHRREKQDPKSVEINSNQEMYHYETSKESEKT